MRDGGTTFSSYYNIFKGNLLDAEDVKLEVVSAKQRASSGKMSGEGETYREFLIRI